MPYSRVSDLPPAVRRKFKNKPKKLRQWMHVFNGEYTKHGDDQRAFASAWGVVGKGILDEKITKALETPLTLHPKNIHPQGERIKEKTMSDFNFFLPISKVEKQKDGSVLVHGYASTEVLDLDGERIAIDAIRKALPSYWEWRNIREMHQPSAVGVGKEYTIDEKGWFLTSRVSDPVAGQKCLDGVYKGYSIGGRKLAKNGEWITELDLIEVSLVDRPANPECKINVAKKAKSGTPAYLLKSKTAKDPKDKAIQKMAKAVEHMTKVGPAPDPPAVADGFSRPAPGPNRSPKDMEIQDNKAAGPCDDHGVVGCKMCLDKISDKARRKAKDRGETQPGGGSRFPIRNKDDLDRARRAIGRSKTPGKTRAWIRTRAQQLGVKLPDKWKKKAAMKLIKAAKKVKKLAKATQVLPFLKITPNSSGNQDFLILKSGSKNDLNLTEDNDMTLAGSNGGASDLDTAVLNILKRAAEPSRAKRLTMARKSLNKARKSRKEAAGLVKECHASLSKSFMAKMSKAGKGKPDDDADDMAQTEKVLKSLQKAYSALTTTKTFIKAANSHLAKAAARSGQRGQEVNDPSSSGTPTGEPSDLRNLSPGQMSRAGGGSEPPLYPSDGTPYPGKLAKFVDKNGMISAATAEIVAENARLEGQVALLGKVTNPNSRPSAFDMSKVYGVNGNPQGDDRRKTDILFNGVDPSALQSGDENTRNKAAAAVAGNYLLSGQFGKSIVDPNFRGSVGARS